MNFEISQDTLDSISLDLPFDYEWREDYSGRGMYGKTCLGIVTDASLWKLHSAIAEVASYDDSLSALSDNEPCVDDMGLSNIYYWPNVSVIAED